MWYDQGDIYDMAAAVRSSQVTSGSAVENRRSAEGCEEPDHSPVTSGPDIPNNTKLAGKNSSGFSPDS